MRVHKYRYVLHYADSGIARCNSTTADMESLIRENYYPNITDSDMNQILYLYPDDPTQGAPYGTGNLYQITPQWKRAASLLGDIALVAVRKAFTQTMAALGAPVWAYCTSPSPSTIISDRSY